jgi:hypothetical protein
VEAAALFLAEGEASFLVGAERAYSSQLPGAPSIPGAPSVPGVPSIPGSPTIPGTPGSSTPSVVPSPPSLPGSAFGGADVSQLMQSVLKQYGGLGSLLNGGFPAAGFGIPPNLPMSPMATPGFGYSALYPAQLQIMVEAKVTDPGFALHKVAVRAYLLQKFGMSDLNLQGAAKILASRQPENPFFEYLASGPSPKFRTLTNEKCPSPTNKSTNKFQWTWERSDAENNTIDPKKEPNKRSWDQSMIWECIFAGNLLYRQQQTLSQNFLINWVVDNPIIGGAPDGFIEKLLPFGIPK